LPVDGYPAARATAGQMGTPLKCNFFDCKDLTQRVLGTIGSRKDNLKELYGIKLLIDLYLYGDLVPLEIFPFLLQ
jgi:hypothetical protein